MNQDNGTSWLEPAIDHSLLLFYTDGNDFELFALEDLPLVLITEFVIANQMLCARNKRNHKSCWEKKL